MSGRRSPPEVLRGVISGLKVNVGDEVDAKRRVKVRVSFEVVVSRTRRSQGPGVEEKDPGGRSVVVSVEEWRSRW